MTDLAAEGFHHVPPPSRGLRDCLTEELRRPGPDDLGGDVLARGLAGLRRTAGAGTGAT